MDKTGGPAFPEIFTDHNLHNTQQYDVYSAGGMSLLDWFAGQALAGVSDASAISSQYTDKVLARHCYGLAAAMLAEKRRREKGE